MIDLRGKSYYLRDLDGFMTFIIKTTSNKLSALSPNPRDNEYSSYIDYLERLKILTKNAVRRNPTITKKLDIYYE